MGVLEKDNGMIAAEVLRENGGKCTFAEFDILMKDKKYFAPINWICGWGLSMESKKSNYDKMCALVACRLGLIKQTSEGYQLCN